MQMDGLSGRIRAGAVDTAWENSMEYIIIAAVVVGAWWYFKGRGGKGGPQGGGNGGTDLK
jgi:hypothetical protein